MGACWPVLIAGRRANLPLHKMLGGAHSKVRCYAGGIDLNFTVEKLVSNVKGFVSPPKPLATPRITPPSSRTTPCATACTTPRTMSLTASISPCSGQCKRDSFVTAIKFTSPVFSDMMRAEIGEVVFLNDENGTAFSLVAGVARFIWLLLSLAPLRGREAGSSL
jgi:hypothetical protein